MDVLVGQRVVVGMEQTHETSIRGVFLPPIGQREAPTVPPPLRLLISRPEYGVFPCYNKVFALWVFKDADLVA